MMPNKQRLLSGLESMQQTDCSQLRQILRNEGANRYVSAAARWLATPGQGRMENMFESVLVYQLNGSPVVTRTVDRRTVVKRPKNGTCSFVPNSIPTDWEIASDLDVVHLYIDDRAFDQFREENGALGLRSSVEQFFAVEDPWLSGYFQMLLAECMGQGEYVTPDSLFLSQSEHLLMRHLLSGARPSDDGLLSDCSRSRVSPLRPFLLRRVTEFIDAKLSDDMSLKDLATVANMSCEHFLRAFGAATGMTPHVYLMRKRLEHAGMLLRTTSLPISAVAGESGFSSASYFSSKFLSHFGTQPRAYRMKVV